MEHLTTKHRLKAFALIAAASLMLSSCYKDNEEDLYPDNNCNTTNVSFSATVWPAINNNCVSCHSGAGASAGIRLGNYNEVVAAVDGGRFLGAIKHENGFSAMPQGAAKLSDCAISQIDAWIAQGKLNN
ncbi:MAG TPA: hypothetical protein PK939_10240 [Bacteroidales bacterium]|nr:hypothetical protein [Bacteroidales bacterium]